MSDIERAKEMSEEAKALGNNGEYKSAIKKYVEASKLGMGDDLFAANCLYDASGIARLMSDYDTMYDCSKKALIIYNKVANKEYSLLANIYVNMGYAAYRKNDYETSYKCYSNAIKMFGNGRLENEMFACYGYYAFIILRGNNVSEALNFANLAIDKIMPVDTNSQESLAEAYLAKALIGNMRHEANVKSNATKAYNLYISANGEGSHNEGRALFYVANICKDLGEYNTAIAHYSHAYNILAKYDDFDLLSCLHKNRADIFMLYSKYEEAQNNYAEAVKLARKCGRYMVAVDSLCGIAEVIKRQGDAFNAIPYYDKAREMLSEHFGESNIKQGVISLGIADCYARQGEYRDAITAADMAGKSMMSFAGHTTYIVDCLELMANCYYKIKDYARCILSAKKSLELLTKLGELGSVRTAGAYYEIVRAYIKQNNPVDASVYFEKLLALNDKKRVIPSSLIADIYRLMASQWASNKDYRRAIFCGKKALGYLDDKDEKDVLTITLLYCNMASWCIDAGDNVSAVKFLKVAMTYGRIAPEAGSSLVSCMISLADSFRESGAIDMAIGNYKGIIDYINNSDNVDQLALAKAYSGLGKAELARSSTNVAMEDFDKAIGYYEAEDSITSRDYADACYQLAENHMKGSDKTIANEYYVMARGAYLASADQAKARMIQNIIDENFYYTER